MKLRWRQSPNPVVNILEKLNQRRMKIGIIYLVGLMSRFVFVIILQQLWLFI